MKKKKLSSVKKFEENLRDIKKPKRITTKIYRYEMVDELIADWHKCQLDEKYVFIVNYMKYLVWYVYNKRPNHKEINKRSFIQYLCKQPKDSIPYRLYKSFRECKNIYEKDIESMLFLLIDEINPFGINQDKTMTANEAKYKESNEFKKYLVDLYETIKLKNNNKKISFYDFFTGNQNAIEAKIKQDFPKLAEKLDNPDFDLYERCQKIIYNRKK